MVQRPNTEPRLLDVLPPLTQGSNTVQKAHCGKKNPPSHQGLVSDWLGLTLGFWRKLNRKLIYETLLDVFFLTSSLDWQKMNQYLKVWCWQTIILVILEMVYLYIESICCKTVWQESLLWLLSWVAPWTKSSQGHTERQATINSQQQTIYNLHWQWPSCPCLRTWRELTSS